MYRKFREILTRYYDLQDMLADRETYKQTDKQKDRHATTC